MQVQYSQFPPSPPNFHPKHTGSLVCSGPCISDKGEYATPVTSAMQSMAISTPNLVGGGPGGDGVGPR